MKDLYFRNVVKFIGVDNYRMWRGVMEINLFIKRKFFFVIGIILLDFKNYCNLIISDKVGYL